MKILITCPPMIRTRDQYQHELMLRGIEIFCPEVVQTLSEEELVALVPNYDGWIIGDDPATRAVFEAGKKGRLRAAVKWGIGVDNVDFGACKDLSIPIINTPNMFGPEVADMALGYVIGLARETFRIDREVRLGRWPKYQGVSLSGKKVGLVGYGDIGSNTAKRLAACEMDIIVYDPAFPDVQNTQRGISFARWPQRLDECDFLVFTCALNTSNYHMLNAETIGQCKKGVRIVNVARGSLIEQGALVSGLKSGQIRSVALDVYEQEPLPKQSELCAMDSCILGTHNASNTYESVKKTNHKAISELLLFLGVIP